MAASKKASVTAAPAADVDVEVENDIEVSPAIFQDLSNLEKEFAVVELDALRKKEFNLKPLYERRSTIIKQLPSFWPQVLLNGPQEFQSILSHEMEDDDDDDTADDDGIAGGNIDVATITAITNLSVERYQIKSESQGEPRSLRFTFEFGPNPVFEDKLVVKEFEYVSHPDGESGGLVSKPVTFKWTKKGKKLMQSKTGGILDLAVELYQAEEAARFDVKGTNGKKAESVDIVDREGLWQYEKLRDKLEKLEDQSMQGDVDAPEGCWLDWFGYRGPVDVGKEKVNKGNKSGQNSSKAKVEAGDKQDDFETFDNDDDDISDDDEEGLNGLLDVEIFPAGEEIAIALADDLWPNVMDYFMSAQDPLDDEDDEDMDFNEMDEDEDEDDDDEDAPDLIEAAVAAAGGVSSRGLDDSNRPSKKQRTK